MEISEFVKNFSAQKDALGRMRNLPEKVQKVVWLYLHGLPVTNYLIIEMRNKAKELVFLELKRELEISSFGLVLRTVTVCDAKYQTYYWVKEVDEITKALTKLESNSYLLAFAPQTDPTDPQKAKGFVVGRYALWENGQKRVEYCKDETRPRILEKAQSGDARFGVLVKEPGSFFRALPGSDPNLNLAILRCLSPYTTHLHLLKESVEKFKNRQVELLCLEFKFNGTSVTFHDFDY